MSGATESETSDKVRIRKDRPPLPPTEATRKRLGAAKRKDTKPEVALRSELHRHGLRFYVDRAPMPGMRSRADIVFPRAKVAVYVDGCFWHGCPIHGTWPKNNAEWWRAKIEANQRRDITTNQKLTNAGWSVIRVWEHENPSEAANKIRQTIKSRTG